MKGPAGWLGVMMLPLIVAVPAGATHQKDSGYVHTGVSSEEQARTYPCPKAAAGGWEKTGPVVCLAKVTGAWDVQYEESPQGCVYDSSGWSGQCIFDIDMGDHVRVWGTRGIDYTPFAIVWKHATSGGSSRTPPPSVKPGTTVEPRATARPASATSQPAPAESAPTASVGPIATPGSTPAGASPSASGALLSPGALAAEDADTTPAGSRGWVALTFVGLLLLGGAVYVLMKRRPSTS